MGLLAIVVASDNKVIVGPMSLGVGNAKRE
jgi:hypothetical protein